MKKFILLFSFIAYVIGGLNAQSSFELTINNEVKSNGDTIKVFSKITDPEIMLGIHGSVKNVTNDAIQLRMRKYDIQTVPTVVSGGLSMCWGTCFTPVVYLTRPVTVMPKIPDNSYALDYTCINESNAKVKGTAIGKYTIFNLANPNDSLAIIAVFTVDDDDSFGKEEITAPTKVSLPYPNPATNKVQFNYEMATSNVSAKIKVYNLLGSIVYEAPINANEKQCEINVSNFNEGIYFYTVIVNSKPVATRKFIVRH